MSQVFRRYSIFIIIYVDIIWAMGLLLYLLSSVHCLEGNHPYRRKADRTLPTDTQQTERYLPFIQYHNMSQTILTDTQQTERYLQTHSRQKAIHHLYNYNTQQTEGYLPSLQTHSRQKATYHLYNYNTQ